MRRRPLWFTDLLGVETVNHLKELVTGNPAQAIHPDLRVLKHDIVVDKFRPSAFLPDHADLHGSNEE